MFDKPYYQDWCVWLGVVAVIAGIGVTTGNAFDLVFAVAFQFFLFGFVPAALRREFRRRRATR